MAGVTRFLRCGCQLLCPKFYWFSFEVICNYFVFCFSFEFLVFIIFYDFVDCEFYAFLSTGIHWAQMLGASATFCCISCIFVFAMSLFYSSWSFRCLFKCNFLHSLTVLQNLSYTLYIMYNIWWCYHRQSWVRNKKWWQTLTTYTHIGRCEYFSK